MNHNRRVCYVVGAFPRVPCGVGDYTQQLGLRLAGNDIDVHVLTAKRREIIEAAGTYPSLHIHAVIPNWSLSSVGLLMENLRNIAPDIVHIQYPAQFGQANRSPIANLLPALSRLSARQAKVLTTLHEFKERTLRWQLRALTNVLTSDATICVTRYDLQHLGQFVRPDRLHYIPIASSIPVEATTAESIVQLRKGLTIDTDELVLAYFGFIQDLKGFDTLLRAIHKVRARKVKVRLLILTKLFPPQTDYHRKMIHLIDDLGLSGVCLLGCEHYSRQDVSRYLSIADIAVLPFLEGASERRSSLITVLQHGLPTITTEGPNLAPEFTHNHNLLLASPSCPNQISELIVRLHDHPELRVLLAKNAKDLSKAFSWKLIAEQTADLYREL